MDKPKRLYWAGRVACMGGNKLLKKIRHVKTSRKETVFERVLHGKIILKHVIEGVDRIEMAQYVVC
jgi:hypothetical protein